MDDIDDAPMPPMGPGAEAGGPDAMPPMGNEPPIGPDEDPMADDGPGEEPVGDEPTGGDDDELMNIINKLSLEDKAAVEKYAKSMVGDDDGGEPGQDDAMPMESRRSFRSLIDETINDVIDGRESRNRADKRMPKEYRRMKSPFKSPY